MEEFDFTEAQLAALMIKLIGRINPVGETYTDEQRYTNLVKLERTLDILIAEIREVCKYADNYQYSMWRAGDEARNWIVSLREDYDDLH